MERCAPYLGSKVVVPFPDMSNVRSVAVTGVMEVLRGSSVYVTEFFRGIQLGPGLVRSWTKKKSGSIVSLIPELFSFFPKIATDSTKNL